MKLVKLEDGLYNIHSGKGYVNEFDYLDADEAIESAWSDNLISNLEARSLRREIPKKLIDYLIIQDGKSFVVSASGMTVKPEYTVLGDFVAVISHNATVIDLNKAKELTVNDKLYRDEN